MHQVFRLKNLVYFTLLLGSCYLLFLLLSEVVIGYGFYKSNNEKSFSNWFNNDFRKSSFEGTINKFFRKDSIECWLIYTVVKSNRIEENPFNELSFTLSVSKDDTLFFNSSLMNKQISKDSGSYKVKIFSDKQHYKEISLPFLEEH